MPNPNNHRVAVYARRSSDRDDHQILSIESQLDELRQLATERGISIAEELTENASARAPGRPVFNRLMGTIRQGKLTGILVWRLDRLARNMVDGGAIIYELSEGRLEEIVTPEATFTNTGDAKFALALQFGAAAKMTDDLSAGVKRGNHEVLEHGKVPGPVPVGYLKTHEHEGVRGPGTAIPDPERFDLVKQIWKDFLAGALSISAIWRKARYEWGLTTKPTTNGFARPIALAYIYEILRNPFYAGKIARAGELFDGEHPPMVTWQEFERVQERLGRHDASRVEQGHLQFLYRGLLHCGHCGRLLSAERHERPGHVYIYYRCGRRRADSYACHAAAPTEEELTAQFVTLLERVTIAPAFQKWALQAIDWWAGKDELSAVTMTKKAKRQLAKAEHELATLTDLVVQAYITGPEYKVRRTNQLARIDHLREALAEPLEHLEAWKAAEGELRETGLNLAKAFREGSDDDKRSLILRTCSEVMVSNKIIRPTLRIPFTVNAATGAGFVSGPPTDFSTHL